MVYSPRTPMASPEVTPFEQLGGADAIKALVERFYDVMSEREPALAKLHVCTPDGKVDRGSRDRFALFLIGWLGGPDDYVMQHGHPRLRMRHGRVAVDLAMRDAWLRCMQVAMNDGQIFGDVRRFLDTRFAEVADFMRNVEG
jgi:hemoglobin